MTFWLMTLCLAKNDSRRIMWLYYLLINSWKMQKKKSKGELILFIWKLGIRIFKNLFESAKDLQLLTFPPSRFVGPIMDPLSSFGQYAQHTQLTTIGFFLFIVIKFLKDMFVVFFEETFLFGFFLQRCLFLVDWLFLGLASAEKLIFQHSDDLILFSLF